MARPKWQEEYEHVCGRVAVLEGEVRAINRLLEKVTMVLEARAAADRVRWARRPTSRGQRVVPIRTTRPKGGA